MNLFLLALLFVPGFLVYIVTTWVRGVGFIFKGLAWLAAVSFFPAIYLALCWWLWHIQGQ